MAKTACLPAFKFLSGESENICRLCFGPSDGGVCLDESRVLKGCDNEDTTVTFEDMLRDLGANIDPSLPQMMCKYCADLAINAFEFKTMCQQSLNKWQHSIEKLEKMLQKANKISFTPAVRTAYLVIKNENNFILTSRKLHKQTNKEIEANIKKLLKRRHKIAHNVMSLKCDECGEKCKSKIYLKRHKKTHARKEYSCPHCPLLFKTITSLNGHVDRVHKPKNIQCSKCAKMFSSDRMLRYHFAENHTTVKCKLCLIQFPSRKDLRQHMNRHNKNKCPQCEKEFKHKYTFRNHLKICTKNETEKLKFICDICNKVYNTKLGLRSHLITFHGFGHLYYCNWCKKPFDSVSKMNNHAVKHTRERNFHCHQCGGRFVTEPALVNHIRLHTGEKPFPCDICGERFLSTSRRMDHKRRKHIGPKKECSVCHSMFFTKSYLEKHMARHNDPQSRLFTSGKEGNKSIQKRKIMYFQMT